MDTDSLQRLLTFAMPFGKYKVADVSNRAYARFSIHNYFFGRALDLVRPSGLVCFITSSHTMEAQAEAVREYIASQAHLLAPCANMTCDTSRSEINE